MRGRKPKPHNIRAAQGNPGNRPLPPDAGASAATAEAHTALPLPFVTLTDAGRTAYDIIGGQLRSLNFVRATDESILIRYAQTLAQYWKVTQNLDHKGTTQRVKTVAGGFMERLRPQFAEQERLFNRLQSMEDRLGLSPVARQQYLLRMAAQGAQPALFPSADKNAPLTDDPTGDPHPAPQQQPAHMTSSPIGMLRAPASRSVN